MHFESRGNCGVHAQDNAKKPRISDIELKIGELIRKKNNNRRSFHLDGIPLWDDPKDSVSESSL
jgi:hypothetical protein